MSSSNDEEATVYAMDLPIAASLVRCSVEDLIDGIVSSGDGRRTEGSVVAPGVVVPFEVCGDAILPPHQSDGHITTALIPAASRPGRLDNVGLPKVLIPIAGEPIICHCIRRLCTAGIRRIVIIVAHQGSLIVEKVLSSGVTRHLEVEFIDLGEDYRSGFASSLISARSKFDGDFLLCTADHIFEDEIIRTMRRVRLSKFDGAVLVESDQSALSLVGLPPTSVRCKISGEGNIITQLGTNVEDFDAIEAGLFVFSTSIFEALIDMAARRIYFTLSEVLDDWAKHSQLRAIETAGRTWFSIETEEQLSTTGARDLSPFFVLRIARNPALPPSKQVLPQRYKSNAPQSLVLGIPDKSASMQVADVDLQYKHKSERKGGRFGGFIVPVSTHQEEEAGGGQPPPLSTARRRWMQENNEVDRRSGTLLRMSASEVTLPERRPSVQQGVRRHFSAPATEASTLRTTFALSIPLRGDETCGDEAYLIEMRGPRKRSFLLAVPDTESLPGGLTNLRRRWRWGENPYSSIDAPPSWGMRAARKLTLPDDVAGVRVHVDENIRPKPAIPDRALSVAIQMETAEKPAPKIELAVTRKVPMIGWALLYFALLTQSSSGALYQLQGRGVNGVLKFTWRTTAAFIILTPIAASSLRRQGARGLRCLRLWGVLILCSIGQLYWSMSYTIAINLTTVGHAIMFSHAVPILVVGSKILTGQSVSRTEVLGTTLAVFGAVTCSFDRASGDDATTVGPSTAGDMIALSGALGGWLYLHFAKQARPHFNVLVFCWIVQGIGALLGVSVAVAGGATWSLDKNRGVWGWLNFDDWRRLPIELLLAFLVDLCGNCGYVAIMKYVDELVISLNMLLQPVVAVALDIALGLDSIPGQLTFVGGALIIGGSGIVAAGSGTRSEMIDATASVMKKKSGELIK